MRRKSHFWEEWLIEYVLIQQRGIYGQVEVSLLSLACLAMDRAAGRISTQGTALECCGLLSLGCPSPLANTLCPNSESLLYRSSLGVVSAGRWCETFSASSLMGFCAYPFLLTLCVGFRSEDICRQMCQLGCPLLTMNLLISYFTQ